MTSTERATKLAGAALLAVGFGLAMPSGAATIIINNINGAGVGFNDTTLATPVGGNVGRTLGEQRLIAFTYAAELWGQTLTSDQPIFINAQFSPLSCTANTATLGSAGAASIFANFDNAPKADTWYPYALANKLAGKYLGTANAPQINANFNSNLGQPNCLTGTFFYLGLDGNHGANTDFVAVLQHEMAHGLGFQTFTSGSTGAFSGSPARPSIWDYYLYGSVTGKLWKDMTADERVASAISVDKLVWTGPRVLAAVPQVLRFGQAAATIGGPNAGPTAGTVRVGESAFGPALGATAITGELMPVVEQTSGAGAGCETFDTANATAVKGRFALIARGVCTFAVKIKNAQNAGATGVIVSDNVVETAAAPSPIGGSDPTVTIPAVRIFLADGDALRARLLMRSRSGSGVFVSLGLTGSQYAGADAQGRPQLFAPNPYQNGSSVSHFDSVMFPNQLMEPAISADLTQSVVPPKDMTYPLLQDIGW